MRRLYYLFFAVVICFLYSCDITGITSNENKIPISPEGSSKAVYQKISAEQAKNKMDEEKEYMLLDVRTDEEFKEERIAGAILIPDYEITSRAETELPDKNALILVYCRSGRRSASVAYELIDKGYTNVYDFGGIIDWQYDTVGE